MIYINSLVTDTNQTTNGSFWISTRDSNAGIVETGINSF